MKRTGFIGLVAAALCANAVPASAQVSEARIRELIKQASENIAREAPQAPSSQGAGQGRPVVRLTLDNASR